MFGKVNPESVSPPLHLFIFEKHEPLHVAKQSRTIIIRSQAPIDDPLARIHQPLRRIGQIGPQAIDDRRHPIF
jgi:hypothetical protein